MKASRPTAPNPVTYETLSVFVPELLPPELELVHALAVASTVASRTAANARERLIITFIPPELHRRSGGS